MFTTKEDKEIAIASAMVLIKKTETAIASIKADLLIAERDLQKSKSPEKVEENYAIGVSISTEKVRFLQTRLAKEQNYLGDFKLIFEEASVMPVKED